MDTFLGSLAQSRCGEGGTLDTNNTDVCSQCLCHTGPATAHGACTHPAHTAQALGCSTRNRPRLALGCRHLQVSRSGSGTRVVLRGADSIGPEPERLRPGRYMQPRASLGRSRWSNLETELCGQGGCTRHEGAGPVWQRHCKHTSVLFVCSVPPSPQCD